jgi:hypothetical protein
MAELEDPGDRDYRSSPTEKNPEGWNGLKK